MSKRPAYDDFLTEEAKRRKPSAIRAIYPLMRKPGMISLAAGLPNPSTFPFESLTVRLSDGASIDIPQEQLSKGLQYSGTRGLEIVTDWVKDIMQHYHKGKLSTTEYCVTNGSQDGQSKAFDALLRQGSTLLVEDPTYSGALAALKPKGCHLVPVAMDDEGLSADALATLLENWSSGEHKDKPFPRVLYTIPTGQNPSGRTQSVARKKAILAVATKHDLLILEDDPYYLLQLDPDNIVDESYLSLDQDGRVLRFDSLSKILSSGLRVGWVSGPPELVQRIELHQQVSGMHISGLSQVVVGTLLKGWGISGFESHVDRVRKVYRDRRDAFMAAATKHLTPYAEWTAPTAGMFVWFKLKSIADSNTLITEKAADKNVLLMPGQVFSATGASGPYVRASFSLATVEQMNEACSRFAELLKAESA